jgi:hypothetical protein
MELTSGEKSIAKILGVAVIAGVLYYAYNAGKKSQAKSMIPSSGTSNTPAPQAMPTDQSSMNIPSTPSDINTQTSNPSTTVTAITPTPSDAVVIDAMYDPLYASPYWGLPVYYGGGFGGGNWGGGGGHGGGHGHGHR